MALLPQTDEAGSEMQEICMHPALCHLYLLTQSEAEAMVGFEGIWEDKASEPSEPLSIGLEDAAGHLDGSCSGQTSGYKSCAVYYMYTQALCEKERSVLICGLHCTRCGFVWV